MADMKTVLSSFSEAVTDSDEEAFLLFTADHFQSQDLGMFDPKARSLELTVAGKDLVLEQLPAVLTSNRAGGSTGAALWRVTAALAEVFIDSKCAFFMNGILDAECTVLELGCGISGILACALAPRIGCYIASDQDYVLKKFLQNYEENAHLFAVHTGPKRNKVKTGSLQAISLDWEKDDPGRVNQGAGVDAIIVSDCVFNETLVEPLVDTCARIAEVRRDMPGSRPTVCIVAQQLRSFEVFEMWTIMMMARFHLFRIRREALIGPLKEQEGFVLHVAVLKD